MNVQASSPGWAGGGAMPFGIPSGEICAGALAQLRQVAKNQIAPVHNQYCDVMRFIYFRTFVFSRVIPTLNLPTQALRLRDFV